MWLALVVAVAASAGVAYAVGRWLAPAMDRTLPQRLRAEAATYLRALTASADGDGAAAHALLEKVVRERTDEPEVYFALAAQHRALGRHERAARIHQSLAVRPGLPPRERARARLELAQDYRRLGRHGHAAAEVDVALEERADDPLALAAAADVYEAAGQWERAAAALGRQLRLWRRDPAVVDRIVHLHAAAALRACAAGNASAAAQAAKGAPRPSGAGARAHLAHARATVAAAQGDARAAVRLWRAALHEAPALALRMWPAMRAALFARGELGEAESALRALAQEDPRRVAVRTALAQLWAGSAPADASRELHAVLELDPAFGPARRALGELLVAATRDAAAPGAAAALAELRAEHARVVALLESAASSPPAAPTAPAATPLEIAWSSPAAARAGAAATPGWAVRCRACGARSADADWRCAACGAWDSVGSPV